MEYEKSTGKVSLMISSIGPGDEGEYTCTAVNKFGEAICTVYIQPEGQILVTIHFSSRKIATGFFRYQLLMLNKLNI